MAGTGGGGDVGCSGNIKNLSTAAKSAKSKKPNFAKANSGTDFLILNAKVAFIYLQNAFTEAPILRNDNLERHIWIETDVLRYAKGGVLSQMTSDYSNQLSSNYVTHETLNPISSKSKMGQWYSIAFFS